MLTDFHTQQFLVADRQRALQAAAHQDRLARSLRSRQEDSPLSRRGRRAHRAVLLTLGLGLTSVLAAAPSADAGNGASGSCSCVWHWNNGWVSHYQCVVNGNTTCYGPCN